MRMTAVHLANASPRATMRRARMVRNGYRFSEEIMQENTRDGHLMLAQSRYHEVYARWQRDPSGFWGEAARDIDWYEPAKKIFDPEAGIYGRWFSGASCNTCFNALDRHVAAGRGKQTALIYDSPVAGVKARFTYGDM